MSDKTRTRKNLISASFSLIIAAVLLTMGTFAWFTVSTKGEVTGISVSFAGKQWPVEVSVDYGEYASNGTPESAHWLKELGLDTAKIGEGENAHPALVDGLLRPVTTYDLKHWYVTDYDAAGNAKGFEERELNEIANIPNIIPEDQENLDEEQTEEGNNHIIYADIWVRAASGDEEYELRLNNPGFENGEIHVDDFETDYGTFMMWTPEFKYDSENKVVMVQGIDAMSSMRIGFLVYNDDDSIPYESYEVEKAAAERAKSFIYEPNGDLHREYSAMIKANALQQSNAVYVQNFVDSDSEESSLAASGNKVGEYEDDSIGVFLDTMVPMYVDDTGAWKMMKQPVVIRQTASEWDDDSDWIVQDGNLVVSSENLKSIGRFVGESGETIDAPYSELPAIATISKDKVTRIRIFFWLEGQDIDCWNQIAGGKMYANLEFRGDPVQ